MALLTTEPYITFLTILYFTLALTVPMMCQETRSCLLSRVVSPLPRLLSRCLSRSLKSPNSCLSKRFNSHDNVSSPSPTFSQKTYFSRIFSADVSTAPMMFQEPLPISSQQMSQQKLKQSQQLSQQMLKKSQWCFKKRRPVFSAELSHPWPRHLSRCPSRSLNSPNSCLSRRFNSPDDVSRPPSPAHAFSAEP